MSPAEQAASGRNQAPEPPPVVGKDRRETNEPAERFHTRAGGTDNRLLWGEGLTGLTGLMPDHDDGDDDDDEWKTENHCLPRDPPEGVLSCLTKVRVSE